MVPGPLTSAAPDRIRVVRVITRLNVGGPAIHALLLARRMDPARFETMLICGRPGHREGDMSELRPESGVAPVLLPSLRRDISPVHDVRAFAELTRIFQRYRPHVVHTHLAKAGLVGRLAARAAGVPVVLHTFHGNVLRGYFRGPGNLLFRALEAGLGRMSTRVIAISPQQRSELLQLGVAPSSRIVEIPLGLDLRPFLDPPRGSLRAELGVGPDVPLVGIVARLVPIKGVDLFLEAAAIVALRRPDARFVVVGDGPLHVAIRSAAAALGVAGRTSFLGWRADLPAIYADLDVVVLASRNEGTPVTIIEALAAGRPVVATAVGGVPDLLGRSEFGLLARVDALDIARSVLDLLSDPARQRALGRIGPSRVFPALDVATLVRRIEALYTELVGAAASGAPPRR